MSINGDASDESRERRVLELETELARVKGLLGALVETLPKCEKCSAPATRSPELRRERRCDDHGHISRVPGESFYCRDEYPYAEHVRAAVELLKGGGT